MTRKDHLLWIAAEECMEVAHRFSKAARFGLEEIQPGQLLPNADRIKLEYWDLIAAMEMLQECGAINEEINRSYIDAKKDKVEKFLKYSKECGTLE